MEGKDKEWRGKDVEKLKDLKGKNKGWRGKMVDEGINMKEILWIKGEDERWRNNM